MAPKKPEPITKTYKTVQLVTLWWENNDFSDSPETSTKVELREWERWCEFHIDGSKKPVNLMLPKELKGHDPEKWLVEKMQAVYAGLETATTPALPIMIYSGHGGTVFDSNFLQWLNDKRMDYTLHSALKANLPAGKASKEPKALFFFDRSFSKACLDWTWVSSQLRPTKKVDHWMIYDTCFAGHAIFAGITEKSLDPKKPLIPKAPTYPVNSATLQSFCAVGLHLKRQGIIKGRGEGGSAISGEYSFTKVVLAALASLDSTRESALISSVFRALPEQNGYQDMVNLSEKVKRMSVEQLEDNLFMDRTLKEAFKDAIGIKFRKAHVIDVPTITPKLPNPADKGKGKQPEGPAKTKGTTGKVSIVGSAKSKDAAKAAKSVESAKAAKPKKK